MGTNCAPLLADLFLYSYESEFLDNIRGGHRKLARSFNLYLCYRYIDDLKSSLTGQISDKLTRDECRA